MARWARLPRSGLMAAALVMSLLPLAEGEGIIRDLSGSHSAAAQAPTKPKKKKPPRPSKPSAWPQATDVITYPPPPQFDIPASLAPTEPVAKPLPERVEADVSTRTIAVTSAYSGAEILVFGAIENSRQPSAESGFYDVVVVVEGEPERVMVRRKSRVAGLWINTRAFTFSAVPSYYATASTRPIEDFTDARQREELGIGFEAVPMVAAVNRGAPLRLTGEEFLGFRRAVVRLKKDQDLFLSDDYGVIFTGRSLFRCKIELPGNVPVGPLVTRVYLFQDGELISTYQSRVTLEREGVERWLYAFAYDQPFLYGAFTVLLAVAAGVGASALLQRRSR